MTVSFPTLSSETSRGKKIMQEATTMAVSEPALRFDYNCGSHCTSS
jgi:hypothetical protein